MTLSVKEHPYVEDFSTYCDLTKICEAAIDSQSQKIKVLEQEILRGTTDPKKVKKSIQILKNNCEKIYIPQIARDAHASELKRKVEELKVAISGLNEKRLQILPDAKERIRSLALPQKSTVGNRLKTGVKYLALEVTLAAMGALLMGTMSYHYGFGQLNDQIWHESARVGALVGTFFWFGILIGNQSSQQSVPRHKRSSSI